MKRRYFFSSAMTAGFLLGAASFAFAYISFGGPSKEEYEDNTAIVPLPITFEDTTKGENGKESTKAPETVQAAQIDTVNESTRFVYEYFHSKDETLEKSEQLPPTSLIDADIVDVKAYYPEWQVREFSTNRVVLRKVIDEAEEESFIVGVYEGFVAVFYENEVNSEGLYLLTEKPVAALSHEEQIRLNDGIFVVGKDKLDRVLEDYGS